MTPAEPLGEAPVCDLDALRDAILARPGAAERIAADVARMNAELDK